MNPESLAGARDCTGAALHEDHLRSGWRSDVVAAMRGKLLESYPCSEWPALCDQAERFARTQPLAGLRVIDATPVYTNTLAKHLALLAAGAELFVGIPGGLPHDLAVVSWLAERGISLLTEPDGTAFDLVLDCAGMYCDVAATGYVELTRSGAAHYADCKVPVLLVDDSPLKRIETSLGTGDGFVRAMESLGHDLAGRQLVVFGAGKVGAGIATRSAIAGAQVWVVDLPDVAPPPGIAKLNSREPWAVRDRLRRAWCVVTATGIAGAASPYAADLVAGSALLANMGVEDEFGPEVPTQRVLAAKAPLNFILSEPTRMRYLDPVMALHNECAVDLACGGGRPGLAAPDPSAERRIMAVVRARGALGAELQAL